MRSPQGNSAPCVLCYTHIVQRSCESQSYTIFNKEHGHTCFYVTALTEQKVYLICPYLKKITCLGSAIELIHCLAHRYPGLTDFEGSAREENQITKCLSSNLTCKWESNDKIGKNKFNLEYNFCIRFKGHIDLKQMNWNVPIVRFIFTKEVYFQNPPSNA